jgi:hypothetical protein
MAQIPVAKKRDRSIQCSGKIAHAAILPATRQAYALSESRGWEYEPYLCPHCGDYHVGHKPGQSYAIRVSLQVVNSK